VHNVAAVDIHPVQLTAVPLERDVVQLLVLAIISLKDEVNRVKDQRLTVIEKQRRMGKAYVDGLFPDGEYQRQKKLLEMELESLVVPAANAAEEAGNLINNLKNLWAEATVEEQRKLLLTMLDGVYIDAKQTKSIVAIRPKPPFKPIFQVAVTKEGSNIRIINEPLQGSSVFLVETGEGRNQSYHTVQSLVKERRALIVEFKNVK